MTYFLQSTNIRGTDYVLMISAVNQMHVLHCQSKFEGSFLQQQLKSSLPLCQHEQDNLCIHFPHICMCL